MGFFHSYFKLTFNYSSVLKMYHFLKLKSVRKNGFANSLCYRQKYGP